MVKATEVTAGLAESNSSLLLGLWHDSLSHLQLTACTPGPMLGKTLPLVTHTMDCDSFGECHLLRTEVQNVFKVECTDQER